MSKGTVSENVIYGSPIRPSAESPIPLYGHCLVSLKNGDEIFSTGSADGSKKKALMYGASNDSWRELTDMPTARKCECIFTNTLYKRKIIVL